MEKPWGNKKPHGIKDKTGNISKTIYEEKTIVDYPKLWNSSNFLYQGVAEKYF